MNQIAIYTGEPALADFERTRLLAGLAAAGVETSGVTAQAIYIAGFDETVDDDSAQRLQDVLGVTGHAPEQAGVLVLLTVIMVLVFW